ncbi:hypothetical protein BJV82DRAFT_662358 [Fennellomyces sp. T-0311]|nr:hypothetical protein BJV82DRAFT_662358 [Fennellomyces sp. T-0311]
MTTFHTDVNQANGRLMARLPTEVIAEILSCLAVRERFKCLVICKYWYNYLIDSCIFWDQLVLKEYSTILQFCKSESASRFPVRYTRLLDVDFCMPVTCPSSLNSFFTCGWSGIEHLTLKWPTALTHESLCNLLSGCKDQLRVLRLDTSSCGGLSNKSFVHIIDECSNLVHLQLKGDTFGVGDTYPILTDNNRPLKLAHLELFSLRIATDQLIKLLEHCPKLKVLSLDQQCADSREILLDWVSQHVSRLNTFDLLVNDGDRSLSTRLKAGLLSSSLQQLRYQIPSSSILSPYECDKLGLIIRQSYDTLVSLDVPLEVIELHCITCLPRYSFYRTPNLKSVKLTSINGSRQHIGQDDIFCIFIQGCLSLESLTLDRVTRHVDDQMFSILGKLPRLRILEIHDYTGDKLSDLSDLFRRTHSLEEFHLVTHGKTVIGDQHLWSMTTHPKLKTLCITDAQQLTAHGLCTFVKAMEHSELQFLKLSNIRCETQVFIRSTACLQQLRHLYLAIPAGSPYINRTAAVHALFDERTDTHILRVTIDVAMSNVWPITDTLTFASDKYKASMANQMLGMIERLRLKAGQRMYSGYN